MHGLLAVSVAIMADTSSAASVMHSFVAPVITTLCAVGSLACVFFLVNGGMTYMTSAGKPESLDHAKQVIKNALLGLVLIFAAAALTQILAHAYGGSSAAMHASTPNLTTITPAPASNGLVAVIVKAITGVLDTIVQSLTSPFIKSLAFFTKSTPLMADNSTVFNLWLAMVGLSDSLFVLVVALIGFHVMSASTFGFNEIEFKHLLPRLALTFLALNTSIFAIDGVIELSNAMIHAVNLANGTTSLWDALTAIVKQSTELGLPSLLIMLLFTVFAVVLVIYYIVRLLALYIGAVISPLVLLLWLIPGFRDYAETAIKSYLTVIFSLFVQVVVLIIAGSLIAGVVVGGPTQTTGTLMPMVTGVAAMYMVLKVPAAMFRLSFVSSGPQSIRQLGVLVASLAGGFLGSRGGKKKKKKKNGDDEEEENDNTGKGKSSRNKRNASWPQTYNAGLDYGQPEGNRRTENYRSETIITEQPKRKTGEGELRNPKSLSKPSRSKSKPKSLKREEKS